MDDPNFKDFLPAVWGGAAAGWTFFAAAMGLAVWFYHL
jgi:hypothetical protein